MLRSRGSNINPGMSAYQRIISNNSYAHDEQGDNPGQEKGSTVSCKLIVADTSISSVNAVRHAGMS